MTVHGVVLAAALAFAASAQTAHSSGPAGGNPREDSPTSNNSANRAMAAPPTEADALARVPGQAATPRKEWKTGDSRGKTPRQKRHGPSKKLSHAEAK